MNGYKKYYHKKAKMLLVTFVIKARRRSIQSWIDGVDLESVLPLSSETLLLEMEQYKLGLQAGNNAKKIHDIPIDEPKEDWSDCFNRRIDAILHDYNICGLQFDGDYHLISYINEHRHLLKHRPQCYLLSDYSVINMMYENGNVILIDFERFEIGDPWNEFNSIVWSALASPHFATGQLHGYFNGEPPMEFFQLLALYISILVLSLMSSWAVSSEFGHNVTLKLTKNVLKWFDHMQNPVPTWYHMDYHVVETEFS